MKLVVREQLHIYNEAVSMCVHVYACTYGTLVIREQVHVLDET